MHAALVEDFKSPPRYREIAAPVPTMERSYSKFEPPR